MRKIFKRVASFILIPVTKWYLRKERTFSYRGIQIVVKPSVFHPGLFSSTLFLAKYLETQSLKNQTLIEVGCGSGLISILAAKKEAHVTALDLNPVAVETTKYNAERNNCAIAVVSSDLFDAITGNYQWIVVNPPFYAKEVTGHENLAWNCGQDFQYFLKFFKQLPHHIADDSNVIMVLTKGCDLKKIFSIAKDAGFYFETIAQKNVLFDGKNYLYQIRKLDPITLK